MFDSLPEPMTTFDALRVEQFGSGSGFVGTDRLLHHQQAPSDPKNLDQFLTACKQRIEIGLASWGSWGWQFLLSSIGGIAGWGMRTRLETGGLHRGRLLNFAQATADEGATALVTQGFREKDGGFAKRFTYEIIEGLSARAIFHFGMKTVVNFSPLKLSPYRFLANGMIMGLAGSIGGILGRGIALFFGSRMETTPLTPYGIGLALLDGQLGMARGLALRHAPYIRRLNADRWEEKLESDYAVTPHLNRLLAESLGDLSPQGKQWFQNGFETLGKKPGDLLTRPEILRLVRERLFVLTAALQDDFDLGQRDALQSPGLFSYNDAHGYFRSQPAAYEAAVSLMKLLRRMHEGGISPVDDFERYLGRGSSTRNWLKTLLDSVQQAPVEFLTDFYFPPGTRRRQWFEGAWINIPSVNQPRTMRELAAVARDRFLNAASPFYTFRNRPEHLARIARSLKKVRGIIGMVEDLEMRGERVLDPFRFRTQDLFPDFVRDDAAHLHDESVQQGMAHLFEIEREALARILADLETSEVRLLARRGRPRLVQESDRLAEVKEIVRRLETGG